MKRIVLVGVVALAAAWSWQASHATAQAAAVPAVTYSKDVLPILQKNCQVCHRPGEVAPMSFLSYQQVRPYARAIKKVDDVSLLEFGTPEAMWHLTVEDFPAIVTMDSHGNSLHKDVETASGADRSSPCSNVSPCITANDAPDAAAQYNIRTIPNLVLFKGGQEVARFSRAAPKSQLKAWIEGSL